MSDLIGNPEDRFSQNEAHITLEDADDGALGGLSPGSNSTPYFLTPVCVDTNVPVIGCGNLWGLRGGWETCLCSSGSGIGSASGSGLKTIA